MSKYLWIVLDPDSNNSPEFFITEAEAIIAANAAAEDYNDGEWSDGVENIVVARITQKSTKIPLPYPEEIQEEIDADPNYRPPYDEYCDYQMRPVEPTAPTGEPTA
jgi:hypothetical protein